MKRILIIEDEEQIRSILKMNLELEGYDVVAAENGMVGVDSYRNQHFDLVILDIMLPNTSGYEICEQIKVTGDTTPILMLSAKDSPKDRVQGLKLGADDYVTKPFDLEELLLRIKNLLNRAIAKSSPEIHRYTFEGNTIEFSKFQATTPKGIINLTNKETYLLKMLIEHKNEVVSRQSILNTVWGYDVYPSTRTIDNFILAYRKYFEVDPKKPQYFKSVRGIGYMFKERDSLINQSPS